MKSIFVAIAAAAFARGAIAAPDLPPKPVPWVSTESAETVEESLRMSKRILDSPIVRSSKGCLALLGESKDGRVIVRNILGPDRKPACMKSMAYVDENGRVLPRLPARIENSMSEMDSAE